ncbi:hypothetical protein AWV80_21990 [Cupriavidus sp. UYMU48A]|nr:hypothetical protein AWV80_21990 [Cupriavidus sp. UYMU48A]
MLEAFEIWLRSTLSKVSSKSDTAKAIGYALNQWEALTLYASDGRVEIDNTPRSGRCGLLLSVERTTCTSAPTVAANAAPLSIRWWPQPS